MPQFEKPIVGQKHVDTDKYVQFMEFVEKLRRIVFSSDFETTDDGEILTVMPSGNSGLPSTAGKSKYMVLSLTDDDLTVDWDWLRLH